MALRMSIFLLASLLLVTARVSSNDEATLEEMALARAPVTAPAPAPAAAHKIIDAKKECPGACLERCSLHSRQNVCTRACQTCCFVCKCVPPGTNGKRELCGTCYTDWTTHGNRTKCP